MQRLFQPEKGLEVVPFPDVRPEFWDGLESKLEKCLQEKDERHVARLYREYIRPKLESVIDLSEQFEVGRNMLVLFQQYPKHVPLILRWIDENPKLRIYKEIFAGIGADALNQKTWTTLRQDPVPEFETRIDDDDDEGSDDLPDYAAQKEYDPIKRGQPVPARQPHDKGMPRRRRGYIFQQGRRFHIEQDWNPLREKEKEHKEYKEGPAPFHEIALGDVECLGRMSALDVLGHDVDIERTASRNLGLIDIRLKNLASEDARILVQRVLEAIHRFLQEHRYDLNRRPRLGAEEYKKSFPNDDMIDRLLREYLRGLIDWYPHVYNSSLNRPLETRQYPQFAQEDLGRFLRDGLKKALGVVMDQFPRESELGRQLDSKIQKIIDNYYYPPTEDSELDDVKAAM